MYRPPETPMPSKPKRFIIITNGQYYDVLVEKQEKIDDSYTLVDLHGERIYHDPSNWESRDMQLAHQYINENYVRLFSGQTINMITLIKNQIIQINSGEYELPYKRRLTL